MTDEQAKALGEQAEAAGFEWKPGCLARYSGHAWYRTTEADSLGFPAKTRPPNPRQAWPDFRDPATLGCLLALVREAAEDAGASVWNDRRTGTWSWMAGGCHHGVWIPSDADGYSTEAEALVAALEWAKGRTS